MPTQGAASVKVAGVFLRVATAASGCRTNSWTVAALFMGNCVLAPAGRDWL